jgi:hypothetical protein
MLIQVLPFSWVSGEVTLLHGNGTVLSWLMPELLRQSTPGIIMSILMTERQAVYISMVLKEPVQLLRPRQLCPMNVT